MEHELETRFDRWRRHGDVRALEQVFDGAAPELLKLALHLAPGASEAEDLVQATFLRALERSAQFDARRALVPWLVGILVHEAARARRERARILDPERLEPRASVDPAHEVADGELAAELLRAVQALAEPYRSVVQAHLLEGQRAVDIAAQLERAPGTVRMQLLRGLELLKKALPPSLATAALLSTSLRGHAAIKAAVLARAAELVALPTEPAGTFARAARFLEGVPVLPTLALTAGAVSLAVLAATRSPSPQPILSPSALPAPVPSANSSALASARTQASAGTATSVPNSGGSSTSAVQATLLCGRVLAADGTPVAGVLVELLRPELRTFSALDLTDTVRVERLASTTSDAAGAFEFPVARAAAYDLTARSGALSAFGWNAHGGQTVELALLPERRLHGRVTKPDGAPAEGAEVHAVLGDGFGLRRLATLAGADGEYELALDVDQRTRLSVTHASGLWWSFVEPVFDASGTCHQDVRLEAGVTLSGRVTDATTGAPLAGATVGENWTFARTTTTDAQGHYVLQGCAQRGYFARAAGYGEAPQAALPRPEGGALCLDFALRPSFRATGRVLDEYGEPVADAYVAAVSSTGQSGDWRSTRTGADGRFVLTELAAPADGLAPGHALLVARPDLATQVYDFPASEGSAPVLELADVVLRAPQVVSGRALDSSGLPVPNARVTLTGWNADRFQWTGGDSSAPRGRHYVSRRQAVGDAEGRFWFADVPAGRYELAGDATGRAESAAVNVLVQAGSDREDLVLPFGGGQRICGRVLDESGAPLAGVSVCVNRDGLFDGYLPSTRTDAQGRFELAGLPAGVFDLEAAGRWLEKDSPTPWIPTQLGGVSAASGALELVLARGMTIEGRILRADGRPAIGLQVGPEVVLENSLGPPVWPAASDLEGRFRLAVPRNTSWTIQVLNEDWEPLLSVAAVEAGTRDLVWTLPD